MRYRLNPFTGLFDAVPVVPPDFITAVGDTATIDLTNTAGTLTADLISFTGFDTDDLTEGTTNLYFTTARARNSLSATAPIFYNSGTGDFSLGTVPITLGGTGQTNAQAAINNLSNNSMTAADGDFFLWSAGNAQFVPPSSIPGLSGNPNTFAYYNNSGILQSSNYWQLNDQGQAVGSTTYTGDNQSLILLNPNVALADTWNSINLISGNLYNEGSMTGFNSLFNINYTDAGGTVEYLNGLNIGLQGNVTLDKQYANWYSNGTVSGNFSGFFLNSDDVIVGNENFLNINRTNTTGGSTNTINIQYSSTADITGGINVINVGMSQDVGNFSNFINHNYQGTMTKGYTLFNAYIDATIGDGTGTNFSIINVGTQNTMTVDGGIIGFGFYNNADWNASNGGFWGVDINNQGSGYTFSGVNVFNNQDMVEQLRGFYYNSTGDARTSTGLDIYMQGNATDDVQGIRVNVQNQTSSTQRVRSLDIQGQTFSYNGLYRPASSLFVDTGNNNFLEYRVASGSPLTGTDTLVNNNIVAFLVEDDVALGPISLGQTHTSAISLLGIATGKTMDLLRGLLVVASIQDPGYANTGTVDKFQGIVYAGALPGGGGTVVNEAIGLFMPSTFDSYAGTNWGIRVQGTTADNYLNKLAIGTSSETAASGLLLDVNGEIGVTDIGSGLSIAEGANARMGVSTLVAGTVTVSTTAVTASSRIFLTNVNPSATIGALSVDNIVAGTSFDILSTDGSETSDVAWFIVEPL